jgi:hypothetical protein
MEIVELIKIVGGLAGVIALVWRVFDEFGSYLRISVKVEGPKNGWVTALTTVENGGNRAKDLTYAFLLLGPESEDPVKTATFIAQAAGYSGPLKFTNDLEAVRLPSPTYVDGRAMIPLPFYFSENVAIVDETLTYRVPIVVSSLLTEFRTRFASLCLRPVAYIGPPRIVSSMNRSLTRAIERTPKAFGVAGLVFR